MKITLAIPCIPKHLYRLHELIQTLKVQTVLPSEIVISISEFDANKAQILQRQLQAYNEHVPIKVLFFSGIAYAGKNRNHCLKYARGDVITFFDADDVMHPRRTEIILDTFTNIPDLEVLLHSYTRSSVPLKSEIKIKNLKQLCEKFFKMFKQDPKKIHGIQTSFLIHNGHISIRNTVKERYNENLRRAQDAEYNTRVLRLFSSQDKPETSMMAIDTPLTIYREHLSSR
jgi:glycosyltransferase involved in cell wall biosynthesis